MTNAVWIGGCGLVWMLLLLRSCIFLLLLSCVNCTLMQSSPLPKLFNAVAAQRGITTEMMVALFSVSCSSLPFSLFPVALKFTTQYPSLFCRNSQMLFSATFFIPGMNLKSLLQLLSTVGSFLLPFLLLLILSFSSTLWGNFWAHVAIL